ncbi:hypothetical protein [Arenibaculum pallidiluteum]|uniref:hypothetical protein n=1 Tax=Arenibaculum pallidiluteum TaxID=2812559 RepID=UPI001A95F11C|nr:hypothetical protein [Arenibaculum pallidiluteum]
MSSKSGQAEPPLNVLITVEDQFCDQIETVARNLKSAGMTVAEVFPLSRVIAGEVATENLGKVRAVEGIASVEEETTFRAV